MRTLIFVGVTLTVISSAVSIGHTCNGSVDFSILYEDGRFKDVSVNATSTIDSEIYTPIAPRGLRFLEDGESFAGENGIEIERHHIQLTPNGRFGSYLVQLFNYTTKAWSNINVYCQPLGLTYRQDSDEVVGFCAVNATYGGITCVPYFKLRLQNGQWVDASRTGSCSQSMHTSSVTNPVILQRNSDYEFDDTRLYFAERGTNRLHEVSLSAGEVTVYEADVMLKIDHLVPVNNASFYGLRVVCHANNSSDLHQKLFLWQLDSTQQQQTGFIDGFVVTESIAFDSYNLDYLVTFNTNRDTVIIKKDGGSMYYSLLSALDNPIQCQNLVGPSTHYLICLARNGHLSLLINITGDVVTNKIIIDDKSKTTIKTGMLAENTVYLLNDQQELSIYLITITVMHLGTYIVRSDINFIIITASSDINCTIMDNGPNVNTSDSTDSVPVAAIVVPIVITVGLVTIFVVVSIVIVRKRRAPSKKNGYTNGDACMQDTNSDEHFDDHTVLKDASIKDNRNGITAMEDIAHPTSEGCNNEARNVDNPPTDSINACQAVSGHQDGALVNSAFKNFTSPDGPERLQDENNREETSYVEPRTEECIEPLPCSEDTPLPPREDPVGDASN